MMKKEKKEEKLTTLLPKKKLIQIAKGAVDFYFQGYEGDLYRYLTDVRRFNKIDVLMATGFYFDLFAMLYNTIKQPDNSLNFVDISDSIRRLHDRRYQLRDEWAKEAGKRWEIQKLTEEMED